MNLIDLIGRKDRLLVSGHGLPVMRQQWNGDAWRTVVLEARGGPQIAVADLDSIYAFRSRPKSFGWFAKSEGPEATVTAEIVDGETVRASAVTPVGSDPVPVRIEWPVDGKPLSRSTGFRLSGSSKAPVAILVHRMLDRNGLYSLAKGDGVEIGPGPNPQILPAPGVSVRYVEEMAASKWEELYDKKGKYGAAKGDWSSYIIGTADNIPAEPGSLDFIFSSHVFEHLASPLGHLKRWRELLRPGGVILAVVPEMNSTKDMRGTPSNLTDIEFEAASDMWRPQLSHYTHFGAVRRLSQEYAREMYDANSSIHVHFYDLPLISGLLQKCVQEHGFSRYVVRHSANHKDFHFMLWR